MVIMNGVTAWGQDTNRVSHEHHGPGSSKSATSQVDEKASFSVATRAILGVRNFRQHDSTQYGVPDLTESYLMLGLEKKLEATEVRVAYGFVIPEERFLGGNFFLAHLFGEIVRDDHYLRAGRSRLDNALIEFPTLRDINTLYYGFEMNPYARGHSLSNLYGNLIAYRYHLNDEWWIKGQVENFTDFSPGNFKSEGDGLALNEAGFQVKYINANEAASGVHLAELAGGINTILLEEDLDLDDPAVKQPNQLEVISLAAVVRYRQSDEWFIELREQSMRTLGARNMPRVEGWQTASRTDGFNNTASLSYVRLLDDKPSFQIAALHGLRQFMIAGNEPSQASTWLGQVTYRFSDLADLSVQAQWSDRPDELEEAFEALPQYQYSLNLILHLAETFGGKNKRTSHLIHAEHNHWLKNHLH